MFAALPAAMRIAIPLLLVASAAHAETWKDRETFGLDVLSLWEPANANTHGMGPMLRLEMTSSRWPSWSGISVRAGGVYDSDDRTTILGNIGFLVRPSDSRLYGTLEAGFSGSTEEGTMDEESLRVDWTATATLGLRLGNWDVHASVLVGGLFERAVWMLSIGRDFVRFDSTTTRTRL